MPEQLPKEQKSILPKIYITISIIAALEGILLSLNSIIYGTKITSKFIGIDISFLVLGAFFLLLSAATFAIMWLIFGTTKPFILFIMIFEICILISSLLGILSLSLRIKNASKSIKAGNDGNSIKGLIHRYKETLPNYNIFGVHQFCPVNINYNQAELTNIFALYSIVLNKKIDGYVSIPSNEYDPCHIELYRHGGKYDPKIAAYFNIIESQYNCSGLATKGPIYYFSNTMKGVPVTRCDESVIKDISKLWVVVYELIILSLFSLALVLLSIVILMKVKNDTRSNTVPIDMAMSGSNITPSNDVVDSVNIGINLT